MKKKVKEPAKAPTIAADCGRHGRYEFPAYDEQGFHRFHGPALPCPKCVADPLPFTSTNTFIQHLQCPKEREWQNKTGQQIAPFFQPYRSIAWEQMAVLLRCQACEAVIQLKNFTAEVKLDAKPGK